ncbi:MAG: FkbM family methyltransferase [Candidatus Magasanikbacteria bacterium]|nr:FkbM family methyltransferase [Candidatus Magasanikbacteria bacterium]
MKNIEELIVKGNKWQFNLRDEADQSVFNEIFKLHEYRRADEVIQNATDPIVDVGAHAGFFVMHAHSLNSRVKIFAIEPEPKNIKALQKHLKENKISKVEIIEAALALETSSRQLVVAPDSHNHRLGLDFDRIPGSVQVRAVSFADLLKQNKIKKVSLLKMDIEGGEYEVFDGMSEKDLSVVNYIILEYHESREKSKEIEEKLRASGFGVQVFPSKFDKTMGFMFAHNKRFKD